MARIGGIDIPNDQRIEAALTHIRGVGRPLACKILEKVDVDPNIRTKDLPADDLAKIRKTIEDGYEIEGELLRKVRLNIKRLKDIGCYRGIRHEKGLPLRGQRTRTNARTRRGRKQAIRGTSTVREKH